tara:strand:+ start:7504 stop:7896 length:393 start_codon:yes stop_codon:yes gene_type:complete
MAYRDPKETKQIAKIQFKIEDILSDPEKMMSEHSVKHLQDSFNKYLYGEEVLELDGQLGPLTLKAMKEYKSSSRYWMGHLHTDINPLKTYELFKAREDTAKTDSLKKAYNMIDLGPDGPKGHFSIRAYDR